MSILVCMRSFVDAVKCDGKQLDGKIASFVVGVVGVDVGGSGGGVGVIVVVDDVVVVLVVGGGVSDVVCGLFTSQDEDI